VVEDVVNDVFEVGEETIDVPVINCLESANDGDRYRNWSTTSLSIISTGSWSRSTYDPSNDE